MTITEIYRHTHIDGRLVELAEQSEIAVTCATCGKTSLTDKIAFETKYTERTYQ